MKKRVLVFALSVLMILSCLPTAFAADEPQVTEPPQVTETPLISEEPTPQPTETPAPVTSPEPTVIPEPAPEPSPEPTVVPEPSLEPVMQPEEAMLPQSESEAYIVNATSGDYEYSVDGANATITGYHGAGGDITIPDTLDGYKVTKIGLGAFDGCESITGVQIPEGVTYIDTIAFSGCKNMTKATLPNSLLFMGGSVFSATAITSIFLPANLSSMSNAVFSECDSLESVEVDAANKYFISESGILFNKSKTNLIRYPQKKAGAYTIPATVTEISGDAFEGCLSLSEVNIPDSVTKLDQAAFYECSSVRSIYLPDGISDIPMWAFCGCTSLESVRLPSNLTKINDVAFAGCSSLKGITIPESVSFIGNGAFQGCSSITDIVFPEGVSSLEPGVLWGCSSLKSFVIPDGINEIGFSAFEGCTGLESVTIPDSVRRIGSGAFSGCEKLIQIDLPDILDNIDFYAFEGCKSLESIRLPETIKIIEGGVFRGCRNLRSVNIPSGVTKILPFAFEGCNSLEAIVIPSGVTEIGVDAFMGCSSLEEIDIPDGISSIEESTFNSCSNLKHIVIPDNVTSIGESAFYGCEKAKTLLMPQGVSSIGRYAFFNCRGLKSVALPINITIIEDSTFTQCRSLESIIIPNNVTSIGGGAFSGCMGLKAITLSENLTSIGYEAFCNTNLEKVIMPENLQSIGNSAFAGCSNLKYAYFSGNAPTMGDNVFNWCNYWFRLYYKQQRSGYSNPWHDYPAEETQSDPNASYRVSVNYMDGSHVNTVAYEFGSLIEEPEHHFQHGMNINGWYPTTLCNTAPVTFPYYVTGDIDLYAKWVPWVFTITFNMLNGSPEFKIEAEYGSTISEPATPTRDGYIFGGWCAMPEPSVSPVSFPYKVTTQDVLYAKWIAAECTVSFESMGGSFIPEVKASYNTTISEPVPPIRSGYCIAGWYLTPACDTTPISFPYRVEGNAVLYAKWQAIGMKPIAPPSGIPSPYLAGVNYSAGSISRAFAKTVYSYKLLLGENEGSVTLTPARDFGGAVMTINGKPVTSYTLNLANGKSAKISVKVKYGKTSKTYTFTVTRAKSSNNALSSLSASAGAWSQPFDPNVTNYTLTLDENTKSTAIQAAAAAGKAARVSPASKKITLNNGQSKTVRITVKAQSGARRTYTITVVRAASTNADLKSLKISAALSPAFNPGVTSYAVILPASKAAFTVSAKAAGYKAAVYIDGAKKPSKKITLANGQTAVVVVRVISQAGNEKQYVITVTRQ